MFGLKLRRLYQVCDKILVRNIRTRRFDVSGPNPGLDRRMKAFREQGVAVQADDAEEFIEKSDSSFYDIDKVYDEHMKETLIGKQELRHHIIKEKYFKVNTPNLLTWSEKEQIRHLATTQPDEWTPEKIAESFPVTVPVVKKLLKYPWKPATEERISRHDASTMRNWRDLKDGILTMDENLRKHFLKFSERTIPPLNKTSIKVEITREEQVGEFERIIQRCAAKEEKNESNTNEDSQTNETDESHNKITKRDYNRVTLEDLTAKIEKRMQKGKEVDLPDKIIVDTLNTHSVDLIQKDKEIDLIIDKNEDKEITAFKQRDEDNSKIVSYPERIRIPKKSYKKGATYKVNDCYYDHDGRFLYRVIGMSY